MKTITIWGYGAANLGDDLFFQTLVRRYPHIQFRQYLFDKYQGEYTEEANFKALPHWQWSLLLRSPFHYPKHGGGKGAQVMIGGSIFCDDQNWPTNFRHYQKIRNTGQPMFVMGSNIGPVKSRSFIQELDGYFKTLEDVTVRDTYSKSLFEDRPNVRYLPDLILTRTEEARPVQGTLGISLMDLGEAYLDTLAGWVDQATRAGYAVTLFSFSKARGDETAIEKLVSRLPQDIQAKVTRHDYRGAIGKTLQALGRMETMIATRFHATILGMVFKQKIFSIVYSDKTQHVLDDLPYQIPHARVEDVGSVTFKDLMASLESQPFDWTGVKEEAQGHFHALDAWAREDQA